MKAMSLTVSRAHLGIVLRESDLESPIRLSDEQALRLANILATAAHPNRAAGGYGAVVCAREQPVQPDLFGGPAKP